jgi:hypothetical protein
MSIVAGGPSRYPVVLSYEVHIFEGDPKRRPNAFDKLRRGLALSLRRGKRLWANFPTS